MHTLYEAEQQQRAFERKIRATKRTLAACDEALNNLPDEELLQKLGKNFSHYIKRIKRVLKGCLEHPFYFYPYFYD